MPKQPNVAKALEPIMDGLAKLPPPRRVMMAHQLYEQLLEAQAQVAAVRRSSVREMRGQGHTLASIGELVGLTTSRVKQIEAGVGRGERRARAKAVTDDSTSSV